jgi:hypothetical protein
MNLIQEACLVFQLRHVHRAFVTPLAAGTTSTWALEVLVPVGVPLIGPDSSLVAAGEMLPFVASIEAVGIDRNSTTGCDFTAHMSY